MECKDCRIQKTFSYSVSSRQGIYTHEISTVWLPKEDLHKDRNSAHAEVNGGMGTNV